MANNWSIVPISSLCLGIYDGPHATPKKTDAGPVFLGISSLSSGRIDLTQSEHLSEDDFVRWTRRVTPSEGDVVFSYETRIGEAAIIPAGLRCCLGRRMGLLRPDRAKVDPRFLLYAYLGPEFQETLRKHTIHGSTVDRIALTELPAFPMCVPPLPEQRAIASILGALDDKIDLNRRMNETLEAITRAIFKSWFVDFDPVRAKAEGRQPFGMDAATAALFPNSFESIELGEIPIGWNFDWIGNVVGVVGGSTPSTKEPRFWEDGKHCWATPKDLSRLDVPVLLDTERKITDAGLSQISSGLLPAGTVLLSSRAPIGYLAVAEVPTSINQGFIAMRCDSRLPTQYVRHWTSVNLEAIKSRANGSTFLEISKSSFRPMPLLLPPKRILDRFQEEADLYFRKVVSNVRESGTLASLRDLLLPKLLSGEIRVSEAERLVVSVL